MKYLKYYEDLDTIESDLKKLLSHLASIIKEFGYDESNYKDGRTWETEFYKGPQYSFCIKLKVDFFSKTHDIDLSLIQSIAVDDEFSIQLAEYFKTIGGINFISEDSNPFGKTLGSKYEYSIKGGNIDNIIKQITKENIELKTTANKYNL